MKKLLLTLVFVLFTLSNVVGQEIRKEYFDNGNLYMLSTFNDMEAGDGSVQYYYITGELRKTMRMINFVGEGDITEYYKSGRVKSIVHMVNGTVNGIVSYYYENGNLGYRGNMVGSDRVGEWVEYDIQGSETKRTQH